MSLEKELETRFRQAVARHPAILEEMVTFGGASGRYDIQIAIDLLVALIMEHQRAILRIAREIEALRQ